MVGAAFGHAGAKLFFGIAFAAVGLGAALFKTGDPCCAARVEFCLGLNQIEGVGEQLGRLAESPAVKLALDSLFEVGVEGDGHGMSIGRERGGGKRLVVRPAASLWPNLRSESGVPCMRSENKTPQSTGYLLFCFFLWPSLET